VFVLVVGAAFAFTVTRENDGGSGSSSPGNATAANAAADDAIGPAAGTDVGGYVDARKQASAEATGERVAVLSLDSYGSEADARAAAGSVSVEALLVAAPGTRPTVVTDGLEAWAKDQRKADESERDEFRKLLPTVDDPAFKAEYESQIARLDAAIESVSPTAKVVFGLVVRGPSDALQALGAAPGVRLVDIGTGAKVRKGAAYRGLRPEETVKVGQPAMRPV